MQERLGALIGALQQQALNVERRAKAIVGNVQHAESSFKAEVAATLDVARQIVQFVSEFREIAAEVRKVAERAQANAALAEQGTASVGAVIGNMERIAGLVEKSARLIEELNGYTNQISVVVSTIREIADQTNLLALNAAIEAARAGEQGRGFAVVADEVRKLAERSGNATQKIARMIEKILAASNSAVTDMKRNVTEVQTSAEQAKSARAAIDEIRVRAQKQGEAVVVIDRRLGEEAKKAQQAAEQLEQVAATLQSSVEAIAHVEAEAEQLRQAAGELQAQASRFRV